MPCPPLLEKLDLAIVSQKLLCQLFTTATRTTTTTTIPSSSPLSRLSSLSIWFMEDTDLPSFPEGVPQNLTFLKNLRIKWCPTLLHLVASGEILHLTALEDLEISKCKELDLTDDGMNWQGLGSLHEIRFESIPKLVCLPEVLPHITTLQGVEIRDCPEWTSNIPSLNIRRGVAFVADDAKMEQYTFVTPPSKMVWDLGVSGKIIVSSQGVSTHYRSTKC